MKNSLSALFISFLLSLLFTNTVTSQEKLEFAYTTAKGPTLKAEISDNTITLQTTVREDELSTFLPTDNVLFHKDQTQEDLVLSDSFVVYQAIQSPFSNSLWVVSAWNPWKSTYEFYKVEHGVKTGLIEYELDSEIYLKPFAWSKEFDGVYCEATKLNHPGEEHLGIFKFNIKSGQIDHVKIDENYFITPLLSPDRKYMMYTGNPEPDADRIEGVGNTLYLLDLDIQEESILMYSKEGIYLKNWLNPEGHDQAVSTRAVAQISFLLPYKPSTCYRVTRSGTPAPTGGVGLYFCTGNYNFNPHEYKATDFDLPNGTSVLAVASGTVTYMSTNGGNGAGMYIVITHADGNQSRYLHLSSFSVNLNQPVSKGCKIGSSGNSGCNVAPWYCGYHLHFDYLVGGTYTYPVFDDTGCIPKVNYGYVSQNTQVTCPSSCGVPQNTSSSNITACSSKIGWSSVSSVSSYKVYWKTSTSSTWDEANTATTTATNYTITGLLQSKTYNYRVRTLCTNNGWSNYSAIKSFTTLGLSTPTSLHLVSLGPTTAGIGFTSPGASSWTYGIRLYQGTWNYTYNLPYNPVNYSNLMPNKTYEFKVKAVCGSNSSSYSTSFFFTTPASSPPFSNTSLSDDIKVSGESTHRELLVYPNPLRPGDRLILEGYDMTGTVSIYGLDGSMRFQSQLECCSTELNLILESGIYFLKVKLDDGQLYYQKVVIQ